MSNDTKDALGTVGVMIGGLLALWLAFAVLSWTVGQLGHWWGDVVKSWEPTAAEKAEWEKEAKKWDNDPANPEYQKRKCVESGGFPEEHFWKGGDITCEKNEATS